jgi:hypothetical protein
MSNPHHACPVCGKRHGRKYPCAAPDRPSDCNQCNRTGTPALEARLKILRREIDALLDLMGTEVNR